MSYCRWSSDNWRCDLYCYEDVSGGFTTHVAGNRVVGEIPRDPSVLELVRGTISDDEWTTLHRAALKFLQTAPREPIGLPHDGESFNDPDLPSFLKRITELREMGYNVPDHVFDRVQEEIAASSEGTGNGTEKESS